MTAGVFKLLIGLSFYLGFFILFFGFIFRRSREKYTNYFKNNKLGSGIFTLMFLISSLANGIWWYIDWIRIISNKFNDGYGVTLEDWNN